MIFPEESGREIVRLVLGNQEAMPEDALSISAMREIGNILTSAFLSAIGQLAGLSLIPSVPGYARDMAGSILDLVLIEFSRLEDTALVIETVFREAGEGIRGHFFLLPDPHTLEATLKAVERAGSPGGRVERVAVGIADLRTGGPGDVLAAVGLGSCVAVAVRDRARLRGSLAHIMLPQQSDGLRRPGRT